MGLILPHGKIWNGEHVYNKDGTPCMSDYEKLMQERKKQLEQQRKFNF